MMTLLPSVRKRKQGAKNRWMLLYSSSDETVPFVCYEGILHHLVRLFVVVFLNAIPTANTTHNVKHHQENEIQFLFSRPLTPG